VGRIDWRKVEAKLPESTREVGILMVVFVPLEAHFSEKAEGPLFVGIAFFLGALLTAIGAVLEGWE
jgi:hypothetical protein